MAAGLDKLVEDIMKESRAKAEEIRREGLTQIEDSISKAKAEAIREAEDSSRLPTQEEQGARQYHERSGDKACRALS